MLENVVLPDVQRVWGSVNAHCCFFIEIDADRCVWKAAAYLQSSKCLV